MDFPRRLMEKEFFDREEARSRAEKVERLAEQQMKLLQDALKVFPT